MTSTSLDLSLVDFAQSLDLSQVPSKFRCTACTNFLVNAYKFGCCDVKFCESCYEASAGTSCPQCGMKLNPGICEPATSTRKTIKAWLKTEKDKSKSTAGEPMPSLDEHSGIVTTNGENKTSEQVATEPVVPAAAVLASVEDAQQAYENLDDDDDGGDPQSDPTDPGDDDIEIQVEPTAEEQEWLDQQRRAAEEQQEQYDEQSQKQQRDTNTPPMQQQQQQQPQKQQQQQQQQPEDTSKQQNPDMMNNMSFNNMNMDMMQQMQQMMASGMNPMAMMGMPMGMNPMAMFGGMNGMNGMNMGMNFNPNQMSQMFGFQNNNMWQNSNSNAFSNGLGGDFQYGFNSSQQQYYSNDDFQAYRARPYGRGGRGRGRGGFGRGRGNFRQFQDYAPNSHNLHEQQQFDHQSLPRHSHHHQNSRQPQQESIDLIKQEDDHQDLAEFAPGGQDEIQDALGDEYHAKKEPTTASAEPQPVANADSSHPAPDKEEQVAGITEPISIEQPEPEARSEETEARPSAAIVERPVESERGPIAEAYEEDLDHAMPPPSAPSGPSGRQTDREFGFRGRGHGRFVSRSRGSSHLVNGHPSSPVGSQLPQPIPRPDSAGAGVVGAPTGPRAMREPREPAPKPAPRPQSNGGGISILGRASRETAGLPDRTRSPLSNSHANQRDQDKSSRRQSRREEEAQYDAERQDYERERRRKKSARRDDYDDYTMDEDDYSQDRRSSHKSRRDRERYSTSSKHQSSHSRRHRDEPDDGYDTNDYGEPVRDSDSKRRHRSSRHRDHDDKSRNRDRTKDRKHSRHEPDREEDDAYAEERRHTKRRREHREATLEVNGRSNSHRSSEVPTPAAATPTAETTTDPYAAEREARIRERQLKEQQRRDNAKSSKSSTTAFGRRVSYKYEDEAERGMLESERAVSAARWR